MNPYLIVGFLIALGLAGAGGFYEGHHVGVAEQKAVAQVEFDRVNKALTDQKAEANADLAKAQDDNLDLMAERAELTHKLEVQDGKNRKATDDLREQLAGHELRFRTQVAGCGAGGGDAQAAGTATAGADGTTVVKLPDALASDLRQLAFDADRLKDEYAKCYGYALKQ